MSEYYIGNIIDGDIDWIESFEDYKGLKLESAKSKKASTIPTAFKCDAKICIDEKSKNKIEIFKNCFKIVIFIFFIIFINRKHRNK
jgi:hypothetical protein